MPVVFKGGTSGNRMDHLAPIPDKGVSQPVINSAKSGDNGNNVEWTSDKPKQEHFQNQTPDFMPTQGAISHPIGDGTLSNPKTTDVMQQDIVGIEGASPLTSGDGVVFRGAPNKGVS